MIIGDFGFTTDVHLVQNSETNVINAKSLFGKEENIQNMGEKSQNKYICRSPDRNLGRSGICLGQIGILFWPRQILDLPKVILDQIRIPVWLGRFQICLGQIGIFD